MRCPVGITVLVHSVGTMTEEKTTEEEVTQWMDRNWECSGRRSGGSAEGLEEKRRVPLNNLAQHKTGGRGNSAVKFRPQQSPATNIRSF